MENYFDNEMKNMKRELTQLKTAAQTSAGAVPTFSRSLSVPISLELNSPSLASGYSTVRVMPEDASIIMATLDSYVDNIAELTNFPATTRSVWPIINRNSNGETIIELRARGNENDRNTLSGGGSVTITKQLTVRSTSEFTMEIV